MQPGRPVGQQAPLRAAALAAEPVLAIGPHGRELDEEQAATEKST